jgi:hypothetical protein
VSYSVSDIEAAFRCAGHPQDTPTLQEAKGLIFRHLEGRCECLVDRCPACGERKTNGRQVHLFSCPWLAQPPSGK